jgi:hypothetical protein
MNHVLCNIKIGTSPHMIHIIWQGSGPLSFSDLDLDDVAGSEIIFRMRDPDRPGPDPMTFPLVVSGPLH